MNWWKSSLYVWFGVHLVVEFHERLIGNDKCNFQCSCPILMKRNFWSVRACLVSASLRFESISRGCLPSLFAQLHCKSISFKFHYISKLLAWVWKLPYLKLEITRNVNDKNMFCSMPRIFFARNKLFITILFKRCLTSKSWPIIISPPKYWNVHCVSQTGIPWF